MIASVGAWVRMSAGHACSGGRGCSHATLSCCTPVSKSVEVDEGENIFAAKAGHSVPVADLDAGQQADVSSCWNAGECGADWRHCWLSPRSYTRQSVRGPWCDVSRWEHSDIVAASSLLGHMASQRSGKKPVYICCFLSSPLLLPTRHYMALQDLENIAKMAVKQIIMERPSSTFAQTL